MSIHSSFCPGKPESSGHASLPKCSHPATMWLRTQLQGRATVGSFTLASRAQSICLVMGRQDSTGNHDCQGWAGQAHRPLEYPESHEMTFTVSLSQSGRSTKSSALSCRHCVWVAEAQQTGSTAQYCFPAGWEHSGLGSKGQEQSSALHKPL